MHNKLYTIRKQCSLLIGHKEIMDEYNCLPVSKDTLRIRQKRENLEKKMIKLEEGIRVLSKPKVFVKIDR